MQPQNPYFQNFKNFQLLKVYAKITLSKIFNKDVRGLCVVLNEHNI